MSGVARLWRLGSIKTIAVLLIAQILLPRYGLRNTLPQAQELCISDNLEDHGLSIEN